MFAQQLTSEMHKSLTSTAWRILVFASIVVGAGISTVLAVIGLTVELSPLDFSSNDHLTAVVGSAATLTYTVVTIIGVLSVTSEYHTGTIGQTLLANPRRGVVYLAKASWAAITGLIVGIGSMLFTVLGLSLTLGNSTYGFDPTSAELLPTLGGIVVITVVWTMIGAGIGALVREQLVAVVGVIIVTQVLEPIVRLMGITEISLFMPTNLTDAAAGGGILSLATGAQMLQQGTAVLVLLGATVLFSALGTQRFSRYELR